MLKTFQISIISAFHYISLRKENLYDDIKWILLREHMFLEGKCGLIVNWATTYLLIKCKIKYRYMHTYG